MKRYSNLISIRRNKNISIEKILQTLGLETKSAYYKKENGQIKFSLEEAKLISELLKLSVEEIFFKADIQNET